MKIENNIAYWCKTEKLAKEFLEECEKQGIKWNNGDKATKDNCYDIYGANTCYKVTSYLKFCNKEFFENDGYKIVEYKGKQSQYPTIISHIVKDNKVIVKLSNGKTGTSKCNAEDKFDIGIGTKLAVERAYEIDKEEEKGNKEKYIKVIDCDYHYERFNYAFNLSLKQQNFINSDIPQKNKIYKYIDKIKFYINNFYIIQDINTEQFFLILDRCCEFVDKPKEKEKFVPYLDFKNGNEKVGNIGEQTDIVDILGNKLCVGDTVLIYKNKEKYDERIICKHKDEEYVMGLRYLKWEKGYGYNYNIINNRSYKEIKNGEVINNVKYILEE